MPELVKFPPSVVPVPALTEPPVRVMPERAKLLVSVPAFTPATRWALFVPPPVAETELVRATLFVIVPAPFCPTIPPA
jgi:hypothetical protein